MMQVDVKFLYVICVSLGVISLTAGTVTLCYFLDKDKKSEGKSRVVMPEKNNLDTLLVLGAEMYNSGCVVPNICFTAVAKDAREVFWDERFDKKNIVNVGDTIVVDLEKRCIVENITQNRIKNTQ